MSTVDSWIGLQQYVVDMDPRLEAGDRRTVVAAAICLHLLRRPPGHTAAPARGWSVAAAPGDYCAPVP
ncbi:hypothetical protein ACWCRD_44100 [Streptomyces sp. NPDC002092]